MAAAAVCPADLDDELQAAVDSELSGPTRKRLNGPAQAERDAQAVHAIAAALRHPGWNSQLLDEICQIIRDTGRTVGGMPLTACR